ncbi:hypothetical protein BDC45DRAFT_563360 [Circinella umbellata]|nr:hypothetical protein BDC45DRAFT_563360 [Circinella umbellata]
MRGRRSTGGQAMQFSTIRRRRLPWRHGGNGRSTGGQAIQFSSIRRYAYLGDDMVTTDDQLEGKRYSFPRFDDDGYLSDMAATTRRSRPMENCIWLGVRIGLFFVGRSTGGQAMQFSTVRRRRLPWRHGDNGRSTGGQAMQFSTVRRRRLPWWHGDNGRSTGGQAIQFSSIRRYAYLGDMAATTRRSGPMENCIWLGTRRSRPMKTVSGWGDMAATTRRSRPMEDCIWLGVTIGHFFRTINWRASDTVFLDSTIRLPWRHGDNGRSTGGQAIQFSSIRRYAYLGDMVTTDDQLEGKRYSFPRFDDDDYLGDMAATTRRSRPMENCIWLGVRIGLFFVGRSTGGQAMQFSTVRRYDYLGGMATTTRISRPMENCIWLGVTIGLFFVGRSTGGQAMQFSTVRRRRLPWWHGDNGRSTGGQAMQFSTVRRYDYLGGMATTIRRSRPMENCIWLGVRIGHFYRTINWRASDTVFLDSTIRLPWRHGDNDTTIKTNGNFYTIIISSSNRWAIELLIVWILDAEDGLRFGMQLGG